MAEYGRKRRPARTPEPLPGAGTQVDLPPGATGRFVIQEHHARRFHYDLRLEQDGVLRSWAVPKGIPTRPGVRHLALQTEDHPLAYLEFEGEIPPGNYGAGTVRIFDRGLWALVRARTDSLRFLLVGEVLSGEYVLVHTGQEHWLLFLRKSLAEGRSESR